MQTNGPTWGKRVPTAPLALEEAIRGQLPTEIKDFLLNHMVIPVSWIAVAEVYAKLGKDRMMDFLRQRNAQLHAAAMGLQFYLFVSPHRSLNHVTR